MRNAWMLVISSYVRQLDVYEVTYFDSCGVGTLRGGRVWKKWLLGEIDVWKRLA